MSEGKEDTFTRSFPPHPKVEKPAWMSSMSEEGRRQFEAARQAGIERDVDILVKVINDMPGFETVPAESITYLATRWAINLADTYEEGMQAGIENEIAHQQRRGQSQAARFQMMAVSAGTAGLG